VGTCGTSGSHPVGLGDGCCRCRVHGRGSGSTVLWEGRAPGLFGEAPVDVKAEVAPRQSASGLMGLAADKIASQRAHYTLACQASSSGARTLHHALEYRRVHRMADDTS
jgi:hypothetical protein